MSLGGWSSQVDKGGTGKKKVKHLHKEGAKKNPRPRIL